jgi:branched-chain amino acid transport system ATP-binding protein
MSRAARLEVRNLQVGYGDIRVLWDITLDVEPGEIVCLIGSNGAGKSTFMRSISGLVPVSGGSISFAGREMTGARPVDFVRAGIAHVPEGRRLFSAMSVRDNLLMGAYLREDAEINHDLEKVFALFPVLADRRHQDAGTLSGGEQQMCAIARGLMARPKLLLVDELSLGLAPRVVEFLSESLREINVSGVGILLVEQDVMNALELAHRAFVIDTGCITASGEASALASDARIREAYMGLA